MPPASKTSLTLGLFALLLVTAESIERYDTYTWIERDARFYVNANHTLIEHGSLEQNRFAHSWYSGELPWYQNMDASWSNLAIGRDGRILPKHPWIMPVASTPLFWAFGLPGTLAFNLLMFALIVVGLYRFNRALVGANSATAAALLVAFATGVREHLYQYSVDVMLLAVFCLGIAALYARRGIAAGICLGLAMMIKPTVLIWLPSVALLIVEQRDYRTLRRALIAGTLMMVVYAGMNTWLFGRPWWTGYSRALIVVQGEQQIADPASWFAQPIDEGLRQLWAGYGGVRHTFAIFAAAVPGLLFLARRRPLYVVAAVVGAVASTLLFSRYIYSGHRFHWPSFALLTPALGATIELGARGGRWLLALVRPTIAARFAASWTAAGALGLVLVAAGSLVVPLSGWSSGSIAVILAFVATRLFQPVLGSPLAIGTVLGTLLTTQATPLSIESTDPLTALLALAVLLMAALLAVVTLRAISQRLVSRNERTGGRTAIVVISVAFSALLFFGLGSRFVHRDTPFRITSQASVVDAEVHLGRVPCDFLAWEHLSWECSYLDRGAFMLTGLNATTDLRVGGRSVEMFQATTGLQGQTRSIVWRDVPATSQLRLRSATADGHPGGAEIRVFVDDHEIGRFSTPQSSFDVEDHDFDTSAYRGKFVTFRLEVDARRFASVLLDGGFR